MGGWGFNGFSGSQLSPSASAIVHLNQNYDYSHDIFIKIFFLENKNKFYQTYEIFVNINFQTKLKAKWEATQVTTLLE